MQYDTMTPEEIPRLENAETREGLATRTVGLMLMVCIGRSLFIPITALLWRNARSIYETAEHH